MVASRLARASARGAMTAATAGLGCSQGRDAYAQRARGLDHLSLLSGCTGQPNIEKRQRHALLARNEQQLTPVVLLSDSVVVGRANLMGPLAKVCRLRHNVELLEGVALSMVYCKT